ncbi:MAG TPA: hypothetical protein VFB22_17280 [Candidatus Baltobacteraceae bacterium]|nr:hypothetical protein [Candidatus Baltobacteraceae bacterium]
MNDADEANALRRGIRTDLVIAICALVVSALATGASLWQSHVVAQQLGVQVWPYVSFSSGYAADRFTLAIENDGLGPAVMRSAVVRVDGKPQASMIDAVHALIGPNVVRRARGHDKSVGVTIDSPGAGSVLRAGQSVTVFTLTSRTFAPQLGARIARLTISTCYCSIVGDCWIATDAQADPQRVARCPNEPYDLLRSAPSPANLLQRM